MLISLTILVLFAAVFTQSLVGFGLALVSMPLLSTLVDLQIATPLVALSAATMELVMVIYYRKSINVRTVWKLSIVAFITIPLGAMALDYIDQQSMLLVLGVTVVGYGLYALFNLKLPALRYPAWVYFFGAIAGLLGGSLNINGPPIVVYGDCRGWGPQEFKSNLQGFFLLNNVVIIASHAWVGNFTLIVWKYFLYGLPAIALGLVAGIGLSSKIQPERFRKIVMALLVVIGLQLIF